MKYLIGRCRATGLFYPIVFADEVVHSQAATVLPATCELIGAGECVLGKKASAFNAVGFSSSLQLGPSDMDGMILTLFLAGGLSGLQLQNHMTLLEMQRVKGAA